MAIKLKISEIKDEMEDCNGVLPYSLLDSKNKCIWKYDAKIEDYQNEDNDKLLFRDCSDDDRKLSVLAFVPPTTNDWYIADTRFALDYIYNKLDKLLEKLN